LGSSRKKVEELQRKEVNEKNEGKEKFLSDEEVAQNWVFWFFYLWNVPLIIFFNVFRFGWS